MDPEETALRQRLTEVDERIDRIGKRFTAGYGSDADRDGWLAWLRELETKRDALQAALTELEAVGDRSAGGASPRSEAPEG